jgi:hypothetical protein
MTLISGGFADMPVMEMVFSAVKCIVWEIGVALVSCLVINVTVTLRFDRHGIPRNM